VEVITTITETIFSLDSKESDYAFLSMNCGLYIWAKEMEDTNSYERMDDVINQILTGVEITCPNCKAKLNWNMSEIEKYFNKSSGFCESCSHILNSSDYRSLN
jgi:predicted nucleic acid-binding Zn ribbon protein